MGRVFTTGFTAKLLDFSFLGAAETEASSGLVLAVLPSLTADEEIEVSFVVTTPSPGFFLTFSLFALTTCTLTLAFTFGPLSFFVLSVWVFDADLAAGLAEAIGPLEDVPLGITVPPVRRGLEEIGGVLELDISSIGSSLTGVASSLSTGCCCSASSPGLFFLIFFDFRILVLDLAPDEEDDGGL